MAIRDLKQRFETQEGERGEALKKTLKKALDEVYGDAKGWHLRFNKANTKTKSNFRRYC